MVHILREASVEKAITRYGDTDKIIIKNQQCLDNLGLQEVQRRLREIADLD